MLIIGRTWKLRERDAKTKASADKSTNAKPSNVQVGDQVRQEKRDNFSTHLI